MGFGWWRIMLVVVLGLLVAGPAAAAPAYLVGYSGSPVTSAVPNKPFMLKLRVKNTGSTVYSGVMVKLHIPEGLAHSKVSPADATIQDDIIEWSNVPIAAGKSFYPAITFTMDSGTPLKTKLNLWVEVTGMDMEANSANFSIKAVASSASKKSSTLSSADISGLFKSVYGRSPTASELKYWLGRRSDKPGGGALLGAMGYHQALNIQH